MTQNSTRNVAGLTYSEAKSLVGMLGDVDPAHFEDHMNISHTGGLLLTQFFVCNKCAATKGVSPGAA